MTLTQSQQDFLDNVEDNYVRFVAAFTAACEADNDRNGTTLGTCTAFREELRNATGLLAGNITGMWYLGDFYIAIETSPGNAEFTPVPRQEGLQGYTCAGPDAIPKF